MAMINLNGVQAIKYLNHEGIFPATVTNVKEDSKKDKDGNDMSWTVVTVKTDDGYIATFSLFWTQQGMPYVLGDLEHLGFDLSANNFETQQLVGKRLYISAKFQMVDVKDAFQQTIAQERGRIQIRIDHSMPLETLGQAPTAGQPAGNSVNSVNNVNNIPNNNSNNVANQPMNNGTMNQPMTNNTVNNGMNNNPNAGMGQPMNPYADNQVGNPPNNGQTLTPPSGGQPVQTMNNVNNVNNVNNGQPVNNNAGIINPMDQLNNINNGQPRPVEGLGVNGILQP